MKETLQGLVRQTVRCQPGVANDLGIGLRGNISIKEEYTLLIGEETKNIIVLSALCNG